MSSKRMECALFAGLRLTRFPFAGVWRREKFAGDIQLWRPANGLVGDDIKKSASPGGPRMSGDELALRDDMAYRRGSSDTSEALGNIPGYTKTAQSHIFYSPEDIHIGANSNNRSTTEMLWIRDAWITGKSPPDRVDEAINTLSRSGRLCTWLLDKYRRNIYAAARGSTASAIPFWDNPAGFPTSHLPNLSRLSMFRLLQVHDRPSMLP